jgi:hypothetical protein
MEFSSAGPNPEDNETTIYRKWVQYSYDWAVAQGATGAQEPDAGDNTTTLYRKLENNLYRLTQI